MKIGQIKINKETFLLIFEEKPNNILTTKTHLTERNSGMIPSHFLTLTP